MSDRTTTFLSVHISSLAKQCALRFSESYSSVLVINHSLATFFQTSMESSIWFLTTGSLRLVSCAQTYYGKNTVLYLAALSNKARTLFSFHLLTAKNTECSLLTLRSLRSISTTLYLSKSLQIMSIDLTLLWCPVSESIF